MSDAAPSKPRTWKVTPAATKRVLDEFLWWPKACYVRPNPKKLVYVDIDKLVFADCFEEELGCERCDGDTAYVEAIVDRMNDGQAFGPVLILGDSTGDEFCLMDGNHRTSAARQLDYTIVPALFVRSRE